MASQQEALLLEVVGQLQAELLWLPHPKNVLKYMKRLNDLPISMDILVKTGIGRTVNSLCKYEEVGAMARNIVGRWRNLVPVDGEFDSDSDPDLRWEESDFERSQSRKRPHNVCSKEDDFQKTLKSSSSQSLNPDFREKKHPKLCELERGLKPSTDGERREEIKQGHQILPLNHPDSGRVQLQPSTSLLPAFNRPTSAFRERYQRPPSVTDLREKQNTAAMRDSKENCNVKAYFPPLDLSFVKPVTKTKQQDPPASKLKKPQLSQDLLDVRKCLKDKEVSNSARIQEEKYRAPSSHKSTGCLLESVRPESNAKDEHPITSYGSNFNNAWQSQRQKKTQIPIVVQEDKGHIKENTTKTDCKNPNSIEKLPNIYDGNPEKQQAGAMLAKVKKNSTPAISHLGGTALPTGQASCPCPSVQTPFALKSKKKTAPSYHEEEGFTGQRMNSKMQVYSGPKRFCQPKLMSLYQKCIRILNNNLDSIFDTGNIPYTVLEPVLKNCTPKQLRRIEEYNHVLIKDTNKLWKIHCNREFYRACPRDSESWRELYLRLQEARGQRLLLLRENMRSSHSSRPSGQQTTAASLNSAAKPPQNIRKRQEKTGTGRTTVREMTNDKSALCSPSTHCSKSHAHASANTNTSNIHSKPSTSSTSSDSRKKPVKKIAPMMAQTIRSFKKRFNRP